MLNASPILERGLPESTLAEKALLGAVLADAKAFPYVNGTVQAGDFALTKHQTIWRRVCALHETGTPIDTTTLGTALNAAGELESVDGLSYLIDLADKAVPRANVESYAQSILESATRRRVISAARSIEAMAYETEPVPSLLDKAKGLLTDLTPQQSGEFATPGEIVERAGGLDSYLQQFRARGFSWPWAHLTKVTAGMFPGELCIIAAGTGRGKTDFAMNVAYNTAKAGKGVAVFSLEMSREQVVNRLAALAGGFNRAIVRHEPTQWQISTMAAGYGTVADMPLYIRDSSAATVAAIEAGVRRIQTRHDVSLVVVDYLQLVTGRGQTRNEQVGSVARGLKVLASTLKVSVLCPCQFSRDHQKAGAKPQLHDLRESGDIEQAANVVLFLHGETKYTQDPAELLPIDLIVAKQRDGASRFELGMLFRGDTGQFIEAT
jgi:replicative DNA helicase